MMEVFLSGYKVYLFALMLMSMLMAAEAAHQNVGAGSGEWIFRMFLSLVMFSLSIELVQQAIETSGDGIKLPVFGNGIKFVVWWTRFEAFGQLRKFNKVLVCDKPADWPDDPMILSPDNVKRKWQQELIEHNIRGLYFLGMALATEMLINIFKDTRNRTDAFPGGIVWMIVAELFRIFQPRDIMSNVMMKRWFGSLTWNKEESPDLFNTKIILIRNECTDTHDELAELQCLMDKAPEFYCPVLALQADHMEEDKAEGRSTKVFTYAVALELC